MADEGRVKVEWLSSSLARESGELSGARMAKRLRRLMADSGGMMNDGGSGREKSISPIFHDYTAKRLMAEGETAARSTV